MLRIDRLNRFLVALVLITGMSGFLLFENLTGDADLDERAVVERIQEIRSLDLQRTGRVRVQIVQLDGKPRPGDEPAQMKYVLREPGSEVEDADIRGYLDGRTKYDFNQGNAYHLRVGRRYNGSSEGELELKRSLLRWSLPQFPDDVVLRGAQIRLWVEPMLTDSPLRDEEAGFPLHLFAYPVDGDWAEGDGGIRGDSFSPAAHGEVWWNEARESEETWLGPGALAISPPGSDAPYLQSPLAVASIDGGGVEIVLASEPLSEHLGATIAGASTFEVLLKLDDVEEDRFGTEVGILSSDFGDLKDVMPKGPALHLNVELARPVRILDEEFVLEAGMEKPLRVQRHPGQTVLIGAEVAGRGRGTPPAVWVRGGIQGDSMPAPWERLENPVRRRWDWSQVMLSAAPNRVYSGETFSIQITEPWIAPGPREKQVPHLILVAPSGRVHHVQGSAISSSRYQVAFTPREFGLWRYSWAFRTMPEQPAGTHGGEGLFYVEVSDGPRGGADLQDFAMVLKKEAAEAPREDPTMATRYNGFLRWTVRYGQQGADEKERSARLVAEVRSALAAEENAPACGAVRWCVWDNLAELVHRATDGLGESGGARATAAAQLAPWALPRTP